MNEIDWMIWDWGILVHKKEIVGLTLDEEVTLNRLEEELNNLTEKEY